MEALIPSRDSAKSSVRLSPLNVWTLPKALWLSKGGFRDEWGLVWLTYFWHFCRTHGVPELVNMIRRHRFTIWFEGRSIGVMDIISTRIHEPDTRWFMMDFEETVPATAFAAFLMDVIPKCRLALLLIRRGAGFLEDVEAIDYEGFLPGPAETRFHIYSLRRDKLPESTFSGFSVTSQPCDKPGVKTEFYLVQGRGRTLGTTGLYTVDFWPHIGWGGWTAIRRRFARLHTVMAGLAATEDLVRTSGQEWFCIETSSAPQYRFARKMYEYYGLRRLLNVEDFFLERAEPQRRGNYVVYGKRVAFGSVKNPSHISK